MNISTLRDVIVNELASLLLLVVGIRQTIIIFHYNYLRNYLKESRN